MDPDLLESLKKHIQAHRKKGYSIDDIEKSLLDAGFDKSEVNEAFAELNIKKPGLFGKVFAPAVKKPVKIEPPRKPKPIVATKPKESWLKKLFKPKPKKPAKTKQIIVKPKPVASKPKKHVPWYVTLFSILIIIVIIAATITILFSPTSCATKECFLERANACERATYQNVIAGARLNYESRKDCTIVKTLAKVADTEPAEIKEKFEGKSMVCAYYKDDFSPMHIETISGLIINCEGPLKQELIKYVI